MCSLSVGIVSALIPTINIDPESPTPKSTVKFTSEVEDQNVIEVRLLIQECNANTGICHEPRENLSMSKISEGVYETSATLKFEDTTYIQYSLNVKTGEGWVQYLEGTKKDLNLQNNNGNNTPGFEFILAILATILIIPIVYKRKR